MSKQLEKDIHFIANWICNESNETMSEVKWLLGEMFNNRTLKELDVQEDIREVYDGLFELKKEQEGWGND